MGLTCSSIVNHHAPVDPVERCDPVVLDSSTLNDKITSIQLILQNEIFYSSFIDLITQHRKEKLFYLYEELETLKKLAPLPVNAIYTASGKESMRIGKYNFMSLMGMARNLESLLRHELRRKEEEKSLRSKRSFMTSKRTSPYVVPSSQDEIVVQCLSPFLSHSDPEIMVDVLHDYINSSQLALLRYLVPVLDEFVSSVQFQKQLTTISRSSMATNQLLLALRKSYDTVGSNNSASSSFSGLVPQCGSSFMLFDELHEQDEEDEEKDDDEWEAVNTKLRQRMLKNNDEFLSAKQRQQLVPTM